ncbi:MAG TPA: lipopolysaccharide heptosyltransferase II [Ignavibacteriaceae bacterium]|nr:lipopolysaccharide heptosyltransferase II [Ignavibacteriaceae bacterium]
MKILILALSGIGDALMFTPALKLLKTKLPEAQVDALVMFEGARDILSSNPNINRVHHFNFLKEGKLKSLKYVLSIRGNYDVTINVYPSNRKEYNLISFLIGASRRVGIKYKRKNTSSFGFLNNVTVDEDDSTHNVKTNIKLCEALVDYKFDDEPALELHLGQSDIDFAEAFFKKQNINSKDLIIGFHPGCAVLKNHIKRRWEPEKFAELAKRLIKSYNSKILLFGGPDEEDLKEKISKQITSDNVFIISTDTIKHSSAIMKRCDLFITNDSSQMHIASALRLNVIAIIGPTNPAYIQPWKTEHKVVSLNLECSPCFFYSPKPLICNRTDVKFKCIKELTADMVFEQVKTLLK